MLIAQRQKMAPARFGNREQKTRTRRNLSETVTKDAGLINGAPGSSLMFLCLKSFVSALYRE